MNEKKKDEKNDSNYFNTNDFNIDNGTGGKGILSGTSRGNQLL